jgi:Flp pilus assembly protein TadG
MFAQFAHSPFLQRLRNSTRASVVVEFALLMPMLLGLIIGILQIGLLFLSQQGLETAAEDAARKVLTGQSQKAGQTAGQFRTSACAALPPFLQCNNLYVDVLAVSSFSSATTNLPTFTYDNTGAVNNSFAWSAGGKGSIVVMRLMYLLPVADLPFGLKLSNQTGGKRLIMATSVFRNEIYS